MKWLTEDALLTCDHVLGTVVVPPGQDLVTINHRRVLVQADPMGKSIRNCPNLGPSIKPCRKTLTVQQGYSGFIRIVGKPVCLDTIVGMTDGTPPGTVHYRVRRPGQELVEES
ncbi:MAG TPA: hypothetical protein VFU69_08905 [Ktedonobacterales bacterium]|nr:hypothetical protein [Ktedonobacterales bacterium]